MHAVQQVKHYRRKNIGLFYVIIYFLMTCMVDKGKETVSCERSFTCWVYNYGKVSTFFNYYCYTCWSYQIILNYIFEVVKFFLTLWITLYVLECLKKSIFCTYYLRNITENYFWNELPKLSLWSWKSQVKQVVPIPEKIRMFTLVQFIWSYKLQLLWKVCLDQWTIRQGAKLTIMISFFIKISHTLNMIFQQKWLEVTFKQDINNFQCINSNFPLIKIYDLLEFNRTPNVDVTL